MKISQINVYSSDFTYGGYQRVALSATITESDMEYEFTDLLYDTWTGIPIVIQLRFFVYYENGTALPDFEQWLEMDEIHTFNVYNIEFIISL